MVKKAKPEPRRSASKSDEELRSSREIGTLFGAA